MNILKSISRNVIKTTGTWTVLTGINKGLKMRYYDDVILMMYLGWHERNTLSLFDYFIKPGTVVFDIGANVGYFTKIISDKVGTEGFGCFFEPMGGTFARLEETIAANKLQNVVAVKKAASSNDGTQRMYLGSSHFESSLDLNWARENADFEEIETIAIDSYCKKNELVPDLIKLDIEGGGTWAVKGMQETVRNHQPIMILESHTVDEDRAFAELVSLAPYKLFRVGRSEPVDGSIEALGTATGINGTILAITEEKLKEYPGFNPAFFQKNGNR
jgi:FkbM family methyltransferase